MRQRGIDKLDGNDVLAGGAGADHLSGGESTDSASYLSAAAGVLADLIDASRNSRASCGDIDASIEGLNGSRYADNLRGDAAANVARGGAGNDTLYRRRDDDVVRGDAGADILYGGGADVFDGNSAKDSLMAARDTIQDVLRGTDRIDLRVFLAD